MPTPVGMRRNREVELPGQSKGGCAAVSKSTNRGVAPSANRLSNQKSIAPIDCSSASQPPRAL